MRVLTWTMLAVVLAGCGGPKGRKDVEPVAAPWKVPLRVINDNFYDAHLYIVIDGQRNSIGMVAGGQSVVLTLPEYATRNNYSGFQILANPIGGPRTYLSPRVQPQRTQTVVLRLAAGNFQLSSLSLENLEE